MTQSGLLYGQNETLHDRRRCMALVGGGNFAEVKRGGRGLRGLRLGSGLQRFQRVGVEEKVNQADVGNAVVVVCSVLEWIVRYHDLFEGITGMAK